MSTKCLISVSLAVFVLSGAFVFAACPSADVTGDCRVDGEDFAVMASQWLTEGTIDPCDLADPCGLVWVTINDPGVAGHEPFNGEMSKYETTNAQYCQFLNAALASGDITVISNRVYGANGLNGGADFEGLIYFDTSDYTTFSQITWNGTSFSVRSRDGYDMSNHPVVMASWYGATAFCNYYGYRLPTEWEWQAVADYDGSYTYGCGTTIDQSKANYYLGSGVDANPLGLSSTPYTSPVNYYETGGRPGPYGYGMCDMAGNAYEWTDTMSGSYRVICGGGWSLGAFYCEVSSRLISEPPDTNISIGFRVCR